MNYVDTFKGEDDTGTGYAVRWLKKCYAYIERELERSLLSGDPPPDFEYYVAGRKMGETVRYWPNIPGPRDTVRFEWV